MDISGKKLIVKALEEEGVDVVFGYPGGMVTDILDELGKSNKIRMVLARHEQALIHEAEGYARTTGKPGIALVTSGPGATNTVTGIADAKYDSIPLVVISGQVSQGLIGNDAFQELDFIGMTRGIVKWGITVRNREDLGRYLKMAFYIATTGKPGPVILDIPKDIQLAPGDLDYPKTVSIRGYKPKDDAHVGQLKRAFKLLKSAKKPLILAGGGIHIAQAEKDLRLFAEAMQIPVVTTVMGKGDLPDGHPLFVGNSGMHGRYAANQAVLHCDVLFSIGSRFSDRITGDLDTYVNNAKIIHIDIDTAAIHKNVKVDIPIVADAKKALKKLQEWATEPIDTEEWMKEIKSWDKEYPLEMPKKKKTLNPQTIMEAINTVFPTGIVVTDVGQHQMWASQYIETNENKRIIMSGGLGTMGFGFPAAIGAKIGNPKERVICITGDGGFQMNMQEAAVSVIEKAPVVICVLNNKVLGMVRQFQNLFYGKRYVLTDLSKDGEPYVPDFIKWADTYGIEGIRVTTEEELMPALEKAFKSKDRSILIEFIISEEELVFPMVKGGNSMSDMILR